VNEPAAEKADYGNWVSEKLVFIPGLLTLLFAALSFLVPVLGVVAIILFICFLYFAYARYHFSTRGRNIQARIQDLVLDRIGDWDGRGKVLDIGCGNGFLTIQIAKKYPQAEVIGMDYWGKGWEYSKRTCDLNAEIEGVSGRVIFMRATASSLPFEDEAFDLVISNLVFHNVMEVRDKKKLIEEALRVVRQGGWFAFQDLFLWKRLYGEVDDLLGTVRSWGIETVEFVDTSGSDFIPKMMKLPFMLGTIGLLYGRK
jgi:SAM-dependent methyltransferase